MVRESSVLGKLRLKSQAHAGAAQGVRGAETAGAACGNRGAPNVDSGYSVMTAPEAEGRGTLRSPVP